MRRNRLFILAGLLIVLGVVCWQKIVPNLGRIMESFQSEKKQLNTPPPPPPILSLEPILADGSYNPIPPVKLSMADDPTTVLTRLAWRERYRPYLNELKPAADSPGFYVYPMLDRTPEGVGTFCTYGWRLTGSAALAQWTTARLAGTDDPLNYGLPTLETVKARRLMTPADWTSQSLADSATRDARYIITGVFDYDAKAKKYQYQVLLLDRQSGAAATTLATTTSSTRGDFESLAAFQRTAARATADALIQRGLAQSRKPPRVEGLDLKKELSDISLLLDSCDSWTMMEGIDRALALSEISPQETAPLQAAAYGYNMLAWCYFAYGGDNVYEIDYCLRAFALAQIARQMDNRPVMTRLTWAHACVEFGMSRIQLVGPLADLKNKTVPLELSAYRNVIAWNHSVPITPQSRAHTPLCQLLWAEWAESWNIHNSAYRDEYYKLIKFWPRHDLLMQAVLVGYERRYKFADMDRLDSLSQATVYLTAGTLASELAAVLVAQGPGDQSKELIDLLNDVFTTARNLNPVNKEFRWNPAKMAQLTAARDFYGIREHLLFQMNRWYPVALPGDPAFHILADLDKRTARLIQDPRQSAPATCFGEFEFTSARRLRFTSQRDAAGPMAWAEMSAGPLGTSINGIAAGYVEARRSNADAFSRLGRYAKKDGADGSSEFRRMALAECNRLYAINTDNYYYLGEMFFEDGRLDEGLANLAAYTRLDPFVVQRNLLLGRFYNSHGYRGMAVRYLGEFLKDYPERFDVANERARSLCEMGHWMDPELRAIFEKPVKTLMGNSSFHIWNLDYLVHWVKDYKKAREMADYYLSCKAGDYVDPWIWKANIEQADGKTSKALEILGHIPIPRMDNIQTRAYCYSQIANAYMDYGRLDLAEPFVYKATDTEPGTASTMMVRGRLAQAKGNYDEAIMRYEQCLDRYGFDSNAFLGKLSAMEKKGERDQVIALLEEKVFAVNAKNEYINLYTCLMRLYAETGGKEKAQALMDRILTCTIRSRAKILAAAEHYKKLYPAEAADIEKHLDEIMAGPDLDKHE